MFTNASGSWNQYRCLLTYKHPAFKMASLPCLWEWGMQLSQRVRHNSIFLCVQRPLGLQVWELRMRAVRARDYTLAAAQQRIPISANTLFTWGFCAQISSHDAVTRHLGSILASVIWIIKWTLSLFTRRNCPHEERTFGTFAARVLVMVMFWSGSLFLCLKLLMLILDHILLWRSF